MCGIVGIVRSPNAKSSCDIKNKVREMSNALIHRGPDADGIWIDQNLGIALGHRRLAIIDLSDSGCQPMTSACGRYVISFNGEIYNHSHLQIELDETINGVGWRGHSDTEILLAGISHWGIKETLRRLIGMFAFCVFDKHKGLLHLARDRMGEKPLYYGLVGNTFRFASELKALVSGDHTKPEIDTNALALFFKYRYIPAPYSIYKGIFKLKSGNILTLDLNRSEVFELSTFSKIKPVAYWDIRSIAERGIQNPFKGDKNEAVDELDNLIRKAVRFQMVADVPLGAFLSGGIDSSTVVSLMQAESSKPVRTFAIGFQEKEYHEAHYAASVANHLGTVHTDLTATPEEALKFLPAMPSIFDEPFADPSQIPTFLISMLTRKHVKVSLSGDGGDELFGGYKNYFTAPRLWKYFGWAPFILRKWGVNILNNYLTNVNSTSVIDRNFKNLSPGDVHRKLDKLSSLLSSENKYDLYQKLITSSVNFLDISPPEHHSFNGFPQEALTKFPDFRQFMMFNDMTTYLPDDILVKVDRAAMSVSLETRIPLLDHRIVEFALSLPMQMKISNGCGKHILRELLYRYVPREMVDRPKMGFAVPIKEWIRHPLREWCESLLNVNKIKEEGILNYKSITKMWHEHLSGNYDWSHPLWSIIVFLAWKENEKLNSIEYGGIIK